MRVIVLNNVVKDKRPLAMVLTKLSFVEMVGERTSALHWLTRNDTSYRLDSRLWICVHSTAIVAEYYH